MLLVLTMLATFILFPIISSGYAIAVVLAIATFITGVAAGWRKDFVSRLASDLAQVVIGYLFAFKAASYFFSGPFIYSQSEVIGTLCLIVTPALVSALVGLELGRFVRAKLAARFPKGTAPHDHPPRY